MTAPLRYLSVCSGIEAASQAFHPYGWTPVAFSEIEKFPCAYLAHHYPQVPNLGDMTKFQEWPDLAIDLLCGGTPCQAFSYAGLREGLADPRGNLMLTFGAIAGRYRPRWLVWENVPGVLSSSGGRDFGAFLRMLGELGYHVAWRVLDAQHVRTRRFPGAVPQRRRRVFLVGYLGDWRRPAAVLFDRESLSGHPAPRREAGKNPGPTLAARTSGGGDLGTDFDLDGRLIVSADPANTLTARTGKGVNTNLTEGQTLVAQPVAPTLDASFARLRGAAGQDATHGHGHLVAHTLRSEGFDASEDGTGRGIPLIAVPFDETQITSPANFSRPQPGDPCHPLAAQARPPAIAFAIQERAVSENPETGPDGIGVNADGAAYTLEARSTVQAVASDLRGREGGSMPEGPHPTASLRAASGGSSRSYVATSWAVRRLTPRECERLQGYPDDRTLIPWRGGLATDGNRYKALGNGWAVNVIDWLAERIQEVDGWGEPS